MAPEDSKVPEIVTDIQIAERIRAEKLMESPVLPEWVGDIRHKYITNGFLMPFYTWDGRYSRPRQRIELFGDFILSYDMVGTVFHHCAIRSWILQESMWFWEYLVSGQEIISQRPPSALPDFLKIEGTPADAVWRELEKMTTCLGFSGEDGGGILLAPQGLDMDEMNKISDKQGWLEGEDGYLEQYPRPGEPRWMELFHMYERLEVSTIDPEVRPAWFHLANYAFFNVPTERLPVFCGIFNSQGNMEGVRFLGKGLSDQARGFIGKTMLNIPIELREQFSGEAIKRERREMTWWLWHNVGHREQKKTLSYREIASITGTPRSSIQTAVARFDKKLREQLDGKRLGRLLRAASKLGLGHNLTYNTLVEQDLAPAREGGIDGFDRLDELI